jgi:hypothetical protein
MEIRTAHGEINKLSKLTGFSRQAVSRALKFKTNTEDSKRIRKLALLRGGVTSKD